MVSFFMEKKISGGKKVITWLKKHLAFDKNKDADIQLKESTRALKIQAVAGIIFTPLISQKKTFFI